MEGSIDKIAEQSLLYDFYGDLLSQRQGEIIQLYTQENYSLGEIASELGISRQAVHDALRNGRKSLEKYENRLGLVQRFLETEEVIAEIDERIMELEKMTDDDVAFAKAKRTSINRKLKKIRSIIDELEDR